jgi:hypothetical protein
MTRLSTTVFLTKPDVDHRDKPGDDENSKGRGNPGLFFLVPVRPWMNTGVILRCEPFFMTSLEGCAIADLAILRGPRFARAPQDDVGGVASGGTLTVIA